MHADRREESDITQQSIRELPDVDLGAAVPYPSSHIISSQ